MDNISFTPEEVARILKISRFTVYELIKRGELTAYRIGRKVRVEEKDLEQYKQNAKGCCSPYLRQSTVRENNTAPEKRDGFIICGQDLALDILSRQLEKQFPEGRFLRRYTGSIDGLMALYHGMANLVTAHLWDGDTGEYNLPYIRRILPGHKTLVYNLVYRMEGFYVAKGNPKEIYTWTDLTRPDIRFINRECGSGARVLLDEQIRLLNIEHSQINGYDNEESSHLAVASSVARKEADVGLGIEKTASQVDGVEFIPMHKERYDLVFRKTDLQQPNFQILLEILHSADFRNEISGIGGYDISKIGQLMGET